MHAIDYFRIMKGMWYFRKDKKRSETFFLEKGEWYHLKFDWSTGYSNQYIRVLEEDGRWCEVEYILKQPKFEEDQSCDGVCYSKISMLCGDLDTMVERAKSVKKISQEKAENAISLYHKVQNIYKEIGKMI